jgi:aspartyl protease family protein
MSGSVSGSVILAAAVGTSLLTAWGFGALTDKSAQAAPQPAAIVRVTEASAPIRRGADGHYWARAEIGGKPVALLVDTGAAAVVLRPADARVLGLNPETLDYDQSVRTASGLAQAATVTLSSVTVAGVEVRDVAALVVQADLPQSLLGMSFLGRLSGFEATPDGLVLRP